MKVFKKSDDLFAGVILGIRGFYEGAIFRINRNEAVTFGRDPKKSQIVIDKNCSLVSRKHCTICENPDRDSYTVVDFSSNGTFADNLRIPSGVAVQVPKGTIISLGDSTNSFKLN